MSQTVNHLLGGLYSWSVTVYFGAVLLDINYSRRLNDLIEADIGAVYGEMSDLLLLIGGFALLCGLLATIGSWKNSAVRNLFATSLLVLIVPGLLAMIFLFPLSTTAPELPIFNFTSTIRLLPIGISSILAFLGLRSLLKNGQQHIMSK